MLHQLRSPEHVMGLPSLEGKDVAACELGNKILAATQKLIRTLRRLHIPFFVENPRSSYLWETPALKRLLASPDMTTIDCHQCQFGCELMKPTRFLLSEGMSGSRLARVCHMKDGKCARTGRKHFQLVGFGDDKTWKTTQAKHIHPSCVRLLLDALLIPCFLEICR